MPSPRTPRVRGAVAVLAATLLQVPAAPGWRQVWSSDFTGSALPGQCTTYDGPHGGPADSYYTPDQVRVSGGMLRLGMKRQPSGGRDYATGGVTCFRITQRYGRFEYRARPPLGAGIDAYATLWPLAQGASDNVLIEALPRPGQEKAYLSSNHGGDPVHTTVGGTYSGAFHTYAIEWSPGLLRILIDGVPGLTDRHPGTTPKWIGFAVSSGDSLTGLPDAATRLPTEFDVDWVRVYAYVPSASAPSAPVPPASAAAGPLPPASQQQAPNRATALGRQVLTPTAQRTGTRTGLLWSALAGAAVVLALGGYLLARRRRGV